MNPVLTRQAARWKRQAEAGEMPDEVYEFIAEGATGIEKRQIINLSKVSRIISDEGDLRKYNDFKHDWSFHRSVYDKTKTNTCGLCGKHPIMERCIIVDEEADKEFILGNSCVLRYLEINIDGKLLEGDEKEEFIKENTKKAKKEFKKSDFSQRYPTAMSDLKKYEPWMKETGSVHCICFDPFFRLGSKPQNKSSSDDWGNHFSVNIGEAKISSGIAVGQLFMIESKQM